MAAELIVDPARSQKHEELIRRCLVEPTPIGCQPTSPQRDPSPEAMVPLWLVLEEPPARGDRYFIAFDPERRCFGIGVREGYTAWYLGDCGGFLDMVERL